MITTDRRRALIDLHQFMSGSNESRGYMSNRNECKNLLGIGQRGARRGTPTMCSSYPTASSSAARPTSAPVACGRCGKERLSVRVRWNADEYDVIVTSTGSTGSTGRGRRDDDVTNDEELITNSRSVSQERHAQTACLFFGNNVLFPASRIANDAASVCLGKHSGRHLLDSFKHV
jgi:hypothetical protein